MIEISINGETQAVESSTISELLGELDLKDRKVAVELNREIVSRSNYETTALSPGDTLEVVHFVGGG